MVAKIIAQLLIAGAPVILRATITAFRTIRQSSWKNAQAYYEAREAMRAAEAAEKEVSLMTPVEAKQILNLEKATSQQEILERYSKILQANDPARGGSEYVVHKATIAKDVLEYTLKHGEPELGGQAAAAAGKSAGGTGPA
eukprot:tig00020927_g15966.t1